MHELKNTQTTTVYMSQSAIVIISSVNVKFELNKHTFIDPGFKMDIF